MDSSSVKRMVVFAVGLLCSILSATLRIEVDDSTRAALIQAIMVIVSAFLVQSGARSIMRDKLDG